MRRTATRHLRSVRLNDDRHLAVVTLEHELVDFEGCSEDEVQAKLRDFEAWAS
jgi:hypothetical protein